MSNSSNSYKYNFVVLNTNDDYQSSDYIVLKNSDGTYKSGKNHIFDSDYESDCRYAVIKARYYESPSGMGMVFHIDWIKTPENREETVDILKKEKDKNNYKIYLIDLKRLKLNKIYNEPDTLPTIDIESFIDGTERL